jgi:glycosyltransferase involved in cell wall biosynthesis
MEAKARESSLFKSSNIVTIPNGLDLERYRPVDSEQARKTLSIETDDELILFTSANSTLRKGGHHLRTALDQLTLDPASHSLVVFGDVGDTLKDTEYDVYELGYIDSSAVPLAYSAADVTVIPSEQDNLPNTGLESLACGTPCVAFEIGGIPDIIESGRNGYLASPFDAGSLAEGIETVIENKKRLSETARTTAENRFDITNTAQEYVQLYRSIL